MISFDYDDEMQELAFEFSFMFNDNIPTMMIPDDETLEGLKKNVKKCLKKEKNLLAEIYDFDYSSDY
jgi:hypothetical protein